MLTNTNNSTDSYIKCNGSEYVSYTSKNVSRLDYKQLWLHYFLNLSFIKNLKQKVGNETYIGSVNYEVAKRLNMFCLLID